MSSCSLRVRLFSEINNERKPFGRMFTNVRTDVEYEQIENASIIRARCSIS